MIRVILKLCKKKRYCQNYNIGHLDFFSFDVTKPINLDMRYLDKITLLTYMLFTWDMVLYWCGRHTAIYLDITLNFNFEQCWMLTIFMWLQRCISPIYQSFSCCLQNVIITPGVNIPPIKNSSITECSCHWQVFHLLYINTFPNITYILY